MNWKETLGKFLDSISKGQYRKAHKYIVKTYIKKYKFIDNQLKQYPKGFQWEITRQIRLPDSPRCISIYSTIISSNSEIGRASCRERV